MTAHGPKTAETGWPVCVRLYAPRQDRSQKYRYKTVEGAARGVYFRFDGGVPVGDQWVIANDRAIWLEGCTADEFLELVVKERARTERIVGRSVEKTA